MTEWFTGWASIVLGSFAGAGPGGIVLREDEIDWADTWRRFADGLSPKARLGAWLGILIGMTAPLWTMGRFASLARLSAEKRARAMDALLQHRIYIIRELTLMMKVCACYAMFRSSEVRARTSYDLPESRRVRLPVLLKKAS